MGFGGNTCFGKPSRSSSGDSALDVVLQQIKAALKGKISADENIPRRIVRYLQDEHALSPAVHLSRFVDGDKTEWIKAASHLAISTQRAASLFGLEHSLLDETALELSHHLEVTKANQGSSYWSPQYFEEQFVQPLESELRELKSKIAEASQRQLDALASFRVRRELVTRPLMEQLKLSTDKYTSFYDTLDNQDLADLCQAVKLLSELVPDMPVDQPLAQKLQASDQSPTNTLDFLRALYTEATEATKELSAWLHTVQSTCGVQSTLEIGAVKSLERAVEKTVEEYGGHFSKLLDLARATIVCPSVSDAAQIIRTIANTISQAEPSSPQQNPHPNPRARVSGSPRPSIAIEVVRVKNRLDPAFAAAALSGGYRDVLMNVRLGGTHICELQVQINSFLALKHGGGHKIYSMARALHLLDTDLGHVRVSGRVSEAQQDGTSDQTNTQQWELAMSRVMSGTCQSLHIANVQATPTQTTALRDALLNGASCVDAVSLTTCGFNAEKSALLVPANNNDVPASKLGRFRAVDLSGNEGIVGAAVVAFLCKDLEALGLRDCKMSKESSVLVCSELNALKPSRLHKLNLFDNNIDKELSILLAGGLVRSTQMTELDLSWNAFGAEGMEALGPVLQNMTQMRILYLENTGLEANGMKFLTPALSKMPNLTALCIRDDRIGPEGAAELVQALTTTKNLTNLDLDGNALGPEGIKTLLPALQELTLLKILGLGLNELATEGCLELVVLASRLRTLQTLDLSWNEPDEDAQGRLQQEFVGVEIKFWS